MIALSRSSELAIDIADEQSVLAVDSRRIRLAVERILEEAGIERAEVSVAIVDDRTIQELNRRYLRHDRATDVLSFVLQRSDRWLDGQIVVSAETACGQAARYGWTAGEELLLYVIHGALHLVGYDDASPPSRERMRRKERKALSRFGLEPRYRRKETL